MTLKEKLQKVDEESEMKSIKEVKTGKVFLFGENTYFDMQIENCVLYDMFPEVIEELGGAAKFTKFNRNDYILI